MRPKRTVRGKEKADYYFKQLQQSAEKGEGKIKKVFIVVIESDSEKELNMVAKSLDSWWDKVSMHTTRHTSVRLTEERPDKG